MKLTLMIPGALGLATVMAADVPLVKIASVSGEVEMPMMAFGTAKTSFTDCTVQDAVTQWLHLGGRHIDTADMYGTQPDVGRALKASGVPRKDIFLTTKVPGPIGAEAVRDNILNKALPQLGTDYIDLVLIHFPCKMGANGSVDVSCGAGQMAERLDTWEGLSLLRDEGKIRALGVSNYETEQVMEIKNNFHEVPATNQVEYHLAYHNETLRQQMTAIGTYLEAWASLGGPTVHGRHPTISLGDQRLKEIATRYNASTPQVVFRWETQKGVVPVTATCKASHATGNLESFKFKLSDADLSTLDALMPTERIIV